MRASKLQPALLGGVVIGMLSALPVISMGNCVCCLWVILGGMVATYLLQQAQPTPVEGVDGAIAGLLAGLVGAVVGSLAGHSHPDAHGVDAGRPAAAASSSRAAATCPPRCARRCSR